MSLSEKDYLYRIRILFTHDGKSTMAELVHRKVILKDDQVLSDSDTSVNSFPVDDGVLKAIDRLRGELNRAGEEYKVRKAAEDAKRAAEEKAEQEHEEEPEKKRK